MTTITIKVNERNKTGKAFLVLADTFLKNQEGIEIIQEKKVAKPKPNKKKLAEIVGKINKAATKRMLDTHND